MDKARAPIQIDGITHFRGSYKCRTTACYMHDRWLQDPEACRPYIHVATFSTLSIVQRCHKKLGCLLTTRHLISQGTTCNLYRYQRVWIAVKQTFPVASLSTLRVVRGTDRFQDALQRLA